MPEDPSDSSPPKLKLKSAGQSTPQASEEPPPTPSRPLLDETDEPAREPITKLRKPISDGDLTADEPIKAPEPETGEQSFDPQNPFGKKPEAEPQPIAEPPTPQPTAETPKSQSMPLRKEPEPQQQPTPPPQTQARVPDPLPERKSSSGVFASLFMILALVLALGGGGYAIWMVLNEKPADEATETSAAKSEATEADGAGLNPIEKAKAAIAKIPFLNTEEVVNEGSTDAKEPAPVKKTEEPAEAPSAPEPATNSESVAAETPDLGSDATTKSAVSSFLAAAHIGGVRAGSNARIMINGQSYQSGETVDAATGLSFIGTKDGKLLFRDKNGIVYAKSF